MANLRAGLIGIGAMGRHHARVLREIDGVDLVAIADPEGDRFKVAEDLPVLKTTAEVIAAGVDYVVLCAPTYLHEPIALELAEAGIPTLIEKPIAASSEAGRRVMEAFEARNLVAAVGHIERFNPALQEMRRRIENGELGEIYQVATRRQGPFPARIADVGVVKDLGVHDFDLAAWVAQSPYEMVAAMTAHRSGREHEDMLLVTGELANGVIVQNIVNWLSPLKERLTTVSGEKGTFVADTATGDLTFFENGTVAIDWDAVSQFRGVTEGNVIRFAFPKREPLRAEHEAFRDAVLGVSSNTVTLVEGLANVLVAEAAVESAATGQFVHLIVALMASLSSNPPRLVMATRVFRPEPGAAAYREAALASALADQGADVTVLTSTAPPPFSAEYDTVDARITVRRLPVLRDKEQAVRGYLQYLSYDIPLFFRLLSVKRPDLVVVEPPPTTGVAVRLACALRRIPYVYYAGDIVSDAAEAIAPGPVVSFVRAMERFALSGAAAVIAVTDGVVTRASDLGAKQVTLVRNGIDMASFMPDGPRDELPPTAVYAGTAAEWLGADTFVRAMPAVLKQIPDAQIVFLGQGTAMDKLRSLAEEIGVADSVVFKGLVPPQEASRWLRSARVGLASIKPGKYDIAFPTKILASLASGTPVLYTGPETNVGFIPANGLGVVVPFNVSDVATALVAALRQEPTVEQRALCSAYAQENLSSTAMGKKAAAAVLAAC